MAVVSGAWSGDVVVKRMQNLIATMTFLCAAATGGAQQMVVTVQDSLARTPVVAAIVTATDQANGTRVYALTNEAGRVTLRLPNTGSWAASVRRIGIVPKSATAIRVESGSSLSVLFSVANLRFSLPRVRVTAKAGVCGRAPVGIDRTSALWEQVTLALRSSALTRGDSALVPPLRARLRERLREKDMTLLASYVVKEGEGASRPFFAADPDSLARFGYVRMDADSMVNFYAPDEIAMLSEAFVRTHCFTTPAVETNPAWAELEFRPIPRRSVPEVAGVAYVDTITGELRRIVFRYVNTAEFMPKTAMHVGGDVSLRRLAEGRWIVSDWTIRMPVMVRSTWGTLRILLGYRESGGTAMPEPEAVADSVELDAQLVARLSERDSLAHVSRPGFLSRVLTNADTSIRAIVRPRGLERRPLHFVSARTVEARTHFARYRAEGGGYFLDSAAIAKRGAEGVYELLLGAPGMTSLRVPDDMSGPNEYQDILLSREWRLGALLPMMLMPTSKKGVGGVAQCFPKMYIDARDVPLSIAELKQLRTVQIATLQIFPPDTQVLLGRRFGHLLFYGENTFSKNLCGLVHLQSYIDYPPAGLK